MPALSPAPAHDTIARPSLEGPMIETTSTRRLSMSNRFLRLAVLYLIAGISLGIYMAASNDHTLKPVHAHLNLLGWASLALFGLLYRALPQAAETGLAKVHFWVYNLALPVLMVVLALFLKGNAAIEPVLAVGSIAVGLSVVCFAINLWKHTAN
jgi:hypothetical protein